MQISKTERPLPRWAFPVLSLGILLFGAVLLNDAWAGPAIDGDPKGANGFIRGSVTDTVNVVLTRGSGFLGGEVTDPQANPLGGVEITVIDQATGMSVTTLTTASDGSFGPTELTAANYILSFSRSGFVTDSMALTLESNETESVFFVLLSQLIFRDGFES